MKHQEKLRKILENDVLEAAKSLLGWRIIRGNLECQIVETEAYRTPDDPGCHAHRGMTPRNRVMFDAPGLAYIYFTYGNHWMLNVVAHPTGTAAAVLIRAAVPLAGHDMMRSRRLKARTDRDLLSGPGKLAEALELDGTLSGINLLEASSEVHLVPGEPSPTTVHITPRIGLRDGAGDDLLWRFCDPRYPEWLSRPITKNLVMQNTPTSDKMEP